MGRFFVDAAAIVGHPYILCIVLVALVFDFINGFHDAANSVATIVGTRVLCPGYAVLWAAFWNFVAAWVFGVHVANTVAKWVHPEFINPDVVLAGLSGAIIWNVITWILKLPTSSSHALLGGFAGAAFAGAWRFEGIVATSRILVTMEFIVISPAIGFILALACMAVIMFFLKRASRMRMNHAFRLIQLGSAAAYSLGHWTNDAQKTMGIISALLLPYPKDEIGIHVSHRELSLVIDRFTYKGKYREIAELAEEAVDACTKVFHVFGNIYIKKM